MPRDSTATAQHEPWSDSAQLERHIETARLSLALHRPWSDQWRATMAELVSLERRRRGLASPAA